ncbi:hypothetical protein OG306_38015 [Streptomyces sp. NBC_01241]|uniref:hypothetical protein n=1 Tax=Streptomyces sp. NBC_01241 TaxID=2903794 RepID=UPI00352E4749|nr:hypothetical protein OG306_38015 [Streptomyces sp. NBC_01241]
MGVLPPPDMNVWSEYLAVRRRRRGQQVHVLTVQSLAVQHAGCPEQGIDGTNPTFKEVCGRSAISGIHNQESMGNHFATFMRDMRIMDWAHQGGSTRPGADHHGRSMPRLRCGKATEARPPTTGRPVGLYAL